MIILRNKNYSEGDLLKAGMLMTVPIIAFGGRIGQRIEMLKIEEIIIVLALIQTVKRLILRVGQVIQANYYNPITHYYIINSKPYLITTLQVIPARSTQFIHIEVQVRKATTYMIVRIQSSSISQTKMKRVRQQ